MPGVNGMHPDLAEQQVRNTKTNYSINPESKEGVKKSGKSGQTEQPASVFHKLDNSSDGKVDYNEAKDSIFSHINSAGREDTINISSGSYSFKSMFTDLAQKFAGVTYETTEEGVKIVDEQISSAARDFNAQVTQMYDQYVQQRNSEATPELSADKTKLEYKDNKGSTFRTENVTVQEDGGSIKYMDSNGKTIYVEDSSGSSITNVRDNNGNVLTSTARDADGNVTQSSSNTYNEAGQKTSRTYTSNGQKLTAEYTYHANGEMATETVKDANGNIVEHAEYDKNGNETTLSFQAGVSDKFKDQFAGAEMIVIQSITYNNKGGIESVTRADSESYENGENNKSVNQYNYDKKGNLRHHQSSYTTTDTTADFQRFNKSTIYRDGSVKKEDVRATSNGDEQISITNKFKKDGSNRFTKIDVTHSDGTNFKEKEKNASIEAEKIKEITETQEPENTKETKETQEPEPFDFKGKTPKGYTKIKGYPDHYYDGNGRVYTFTANEEGKPVAKREFSAQARLYESRFKRAKETEE
ncbi:hypothetical protein IKJ53_07005 [bacterium]|nr:hypothetical protein [bacterium]